MDAGTEKHEEASPARRNSCNWTKVKTLVQRHATWDTKFTEVEQKEAQFMNAQWAMMRDQMRSFSLDLGKHQHNMDSFQKEQSVLNVALKKQLKDTEQELEVEKSERAVGDTRLEKMILKLQQDLEAEVKMREDVNEQLKDEFERQRNEAAKQLSELKTEANEMRQEIYRNKSSLEVVTKKLDPLHEYMSTQVSENKASIEELRMKFRESSDTLKKNFDNRVKEVDEKIKGLKESVAQEQADRSEEDRRVSDIMKQLRDKVQVISDDLPGMKKDIKDLDNTLNPRLNEHKQAIDRNFLESQDGRSRLEQRINDLTKKVENEVHARTGLQEDVNTMVEGLRVKMRTSIKQEFDHAMTRIEHLNESIQSQLDSEQKAREEKDQTLEKQMLETKQELISKVDDTLTQIKDLNAALREEIMTVDKGVKTTLAALSKELSKQIRALIDCLGMSISEDDLTFESIIEASEEQSDDLGRLFKDVGDRFLQQCSLPKHTMAASRRTSSSILLGLMSTPQNIKSIPVKADAIKTLPTLSSAKKAIIGAVLARDRVELILKSTDGSIVQYSDDSAQVSDAQMKLKQKIEFKTVLHGQPPEATFKDDLRVTGLLGDVVEILNVYSTATVLIEGHTATTKEKMDSWAHELASNRAEKVKATLMSMGIASQRLRSVGLPGHLGINSPDVIMKIVSF